MKFETKLPNENEALNSVIKDINKNQKNCSQVLKVRKY